MTDATIRHCGSIVLIKLETEAARDWVRDNVPDDAPYLAASLAVEPRYVDALIDGMQGAGLVIA